MSIQVYKARDIVDDQMSIFVFDSNNPGRYICGTYAIVLSAFGNDENIIEYLKDEVRNNSWDSYNDVGRRETMTEPVLIAEW